MSIPAFPSFSPIKDLPLEPNEKLIWDGQAESIAGIYTEPNGSSSLAWSTRLKAEITITDRRIFYCRQDGLKLQGGQVLFEWPVNVEHQGTHIHNGPIDPYVALLCEGDGGTLKIVFRFGRRDAMKVALMLVTAIAKYRLQFAFDKDRLMMPDVIMGLDRQTKEPVAGVRTSDLLKGHKVATYGLPGWSKLSTLL